MPKLDSGNSSVDKSSGAVLFHKSPELLEIIRLRKEVEEVNHKMDVILDILQGGERNGGKVAK